MATEMEEKTSLTPIPLVEKEPPAYDDVVEKDISAPLRGPATYNGLKRQIGLIGCGGLLIGTIIGSGIFASPKSVFSKTNSPGAALLVWTGCGFLAMFASLSYCELGSMFPNASGAEYHYLGEAFGPIPAFLFAYTQTLILRPAQLAIIALTCGEYLLVAFNVEDMLYSKLVAFAVIFILLVVNVASVRWATFVQVFFTGAKLIAVVILIVTGFVRLGQGYNDSFEDPFNGTTTSISSIAYAFYSGLWAYDGWNNLNYVTEELKNPLRDLPLMIMLGIPFITGCYVTVNVAYLTVLTPEHLSNSFTVAVDVAKKLYGVMAWCIPVLVACSTFGAANGCTFTSGRLVNVAARKRHMPKLLAMIHRNRGTPLPAILFTCILAWIMLIPESSSFEKLVNYFSFAAWTFYGATIAALLWMRYKRPHAKRPYKVFIGIPIVVLFCAVYLVVAPFIENPWESFGALLFILFGVILYLVFVKYGDVVVPKFMTSGFENITCRIQKIANLSLPSREGDENTCNDTQDCTGINEPS